MSWKGKPDGRKSLRKISVIKWIWPSSNLKSAVATSSGNIIWNGF